MFAITMNPGYAGRSEIPSNNLTWSSVEMTVPDYKIIAQNMLASEGIKDDRQKESSLGFVVVRTLERLAKECSKSNWYDFGMRKLKSIITVAGRLRREQSEWIDAKCLHQAMLQTLCSAFSKEDKPKAEKILHGWVDVSLKEILAVRHGALLVSHQVSGKDVGSRKIS